VYKSFEVGSGRTPREGRKPAFKKILPSHGPEYFHEAADDE